MTSYSGSYSVLPSTPAELPRWRPDVVCDICGQNEAELGLRLRPEPEPAGSFALPTVMVICPVCSDLVVRNADTELAERYATGRDWPDADEAVAALRARQVAGPEPLLIPAVP
jgi:hypothetical protein